VIPPLSGLASSTAIGTSSSDSITPPLDGLGPVEEEVLLEQRAIVIEGGQHLDLADEAADVVDEDVDAAAAFVRLLDGPFQRLAVHAVDGEREPVGDGPPDRKPRSGVALYRSSTC
jgi:hypothetical protein